MRRNLDRRTEYGEDTIDIQLKSVLISSGFLLDFYRISFDFFSSFVRLFPACIELIRKFCSMIKLVVFDLDGTLINAYPAVEQSVNRVLRHFGLPPQMPEAIKRAVGFGPQRLLETFLDGKKMNEALALYERIHAQALLKGSALLPGAWELLQALKKRGCRLAVASNRPKRFSLIVIEHLGIASFFDRVLCGDELAQGKPHPEILQTLMRELSVDSTQTLYVGDMVIDVETGASAGVKTVVLPTGSHTEEELRAAGPWRVIRRLEEVLDFVE